MKRRLSLALLSALVFSACHAGATGSVIPTVTPQHEASTTRLALQSNGVTTKIIFSGFAGAAYVAMHNGNAYVTDTGNHALKKVAPDGTVSIVSADFSHIGAVAVDGAGTVFVAATDRIYRLTPSGRQSIFKSPYHPLRGIAVDAHDNVYVATGQSQIRKIAPNGTVTLIGKGFLDPFDVAVDASGAVYVADAYSIKVVRNGKVYVVKVHAPGYGFIQPGAVDVDSNGNIYVTDRNSDALLKLTPHVGGVVLGRFGGIGDVAVTKEGTPYVTAFVGGLFKITPRGIENVAYSTPLSVGTDPSGNVFTTTVNAYKIALDGQVKEIAPQPKLGNYYLNGIAGDASGNVYVSSSGQTIYKIAPDGVVSTFVSTLGEPEQLAIDSSSNVYVADFSNNEIDKIAPNGTFLKRWIAGSPNGVAVDAQDNVYFTDGTRIDEISRSGRRVVGGGFTYPSSVAVDPTGNIYVSDIRANAVYKVLGKGRNVQVGSGFQNPLQVATDAAGDLYVADYGHGKVKELTFYSSPLSRNHQLSRF